MRRGEHVPRAFQAPVDVHASADGQVYMFKRRPNETAVSSSDDDEISVVETRPQAFREQEQGGLRNVEVLEREVLEGDTLNKLALQYGCKVADIKRVNNLMQEQDLFALKSVKIPIQKHSFLMETFTDLNKPQDEMPVSPTRLVKPQDRTRAQPHLQEVTDFLMEVDNDIEKLIQTTNDQQEDSSESSRRQQRFSLGGRRLTSHGADWGIQWWNALVAVLLICIVLPIFYLIYFKTKDNGAASTTDGSGARP
ncbi:lysM and putative peptidoglycan-binding domain-containing protein 4 [Betta splendens]|uniref:LysM and putative peptidoglycan-binding domain-containing protein 4 n=1 Tax=Betta splendens TaxID=158456 RepID=A0A6P7MP78_BETSP|nr:lysM and putative peptidoglycan-binding domain-containing protein 4 [Betta splendens]XP_040927039.1 lysM and putative peptidoglycan-binding domain-containing protein 4 [Betta splendens]XP_040927040.1 lysM and putative peptidoglycan-binding domain-containing protein 4 [Betta splendens]